MKRQRIVDQPENPTANAAFGRIAHSDSKFAKQRYKAFVRTSCPGSKGVEGDAPIADDAIPPQFGIGEYALPQSLGGALVRERRTDWQRVDCAHQFANQLFLAPQRTVGLEARSIAYGLAQSVIQGHSIKFFGTQIDQFFA